MAKKKRANADLSGLQKRLTALAGLVVIVGGAALVLFLAGVLGNQGGGTAEVVDPETGEVRRIEIEKALVLEPPPVQGAGDLEVAPREGALAPDFEISDFEGARHRLSDFRGRPVYVNFWATWCIPCQRELPDVQELLDRHKDELVIITVNRAEPLNRAEGFFESIPKLNGEPGVSFTVNGMDPDDTLYNAYRGLGMPVSVFIDGNGVVTRVFNGLIDLTTMEESVAAARESTATLGGS